MTLNSLAVTVIVLNYCSLEVSLQCVDYIRRSDHPNLRVLVLDNSSPDGSGAQLAKVLPSHEFLQLACNIGYAGGNNVGIELALKAGADHVFILNPDVRVLPDTISECVAITTASNGIGAVNPVQVEADGLTIDGKFFRTALRPMGYTNPCYAELDLPRAIDTHELLGAALFLPRSALERVGGFDPLFFAYGEETDLCRRLRHHGLRLVVAGRAPVQHLRTKESSGVSDRVLFLRLKGMYLGALKDPRRTMRSALCRTLGRALRDLAGLSRGEYPFNQYPVTRWHTFKAIGWVLRHLPSIGRHRQLERVGRAHV